MTARLLSKRRVPKVWGRRDLPEALGGPGEEPIGEIWYDPPAELEALLVKILLCEDRLSVQVHPGAAADPEGCGKEECWLVLEAREGAELAIGLADEIGRDALRQAALDGSIEHMLARYPARAGDFFCIPAGTIHAIGAGLTLVEVQQNRDLTYRLYDYGRPRELHLERALEVATRAPHDALLRRSLGPHGPARLVDGPAFRLDRLAGSPDTDTLERHAGPCLCLPLTGSASGGGVKARAGECLFADSLGEIELGECDSALVASPL